MKAYLGIGTNIGDRMKNLQDSIDALNLLPMTSVTDVSNVYETDPVGYDNQDDFLNIVVALLSYPKILNIGRSKFSIFYFNCCNIGWINTRSYCIAQGTLSTSYDKVYGKESV